MGKDKDQSKLARFPVIGIILIAAGILFLAGTLIPDFTVSRLWPLFMLIPVFIFVQVLADEGMESSGVIVPGVILLYLTIYFLWLNYTSWSNISGTWPNFLLAPASGLFGFYLVSRNTGLLIPVIVLVITALVFFGGLVHSDTGIALGLIALGLVIVLSPLLNRKKA
jgi:hypothetical protein